MSDHPIESMMNTTMEKIKTMVDASTMIGDPITTPDGTVIIPVSKVSFGFASGGSDIPTIKQAGQQGFVRRRGGRWDYPDAGSVFGYSRRGGKAFAGGSL